MATTFKPRQEDESNQKFQARLKAYLDMKNSKATPYEEVKAGMDAPDTRPRTWRRGSLYAKDQPKSEFEEPVETDPILTRQRVKPEEEAEVVEEEVPEEATYKEDIDKLNKTYQVNMKALNKFGGDLPDFERDAFNKKIDVAWAKYKDDKEGLKKKELIHQIILGMATMAAMMWGAKHGADISQVEMPVVDYTDLRKQLGDDFNSEINMLESKQKAMEYELKYKRGEITKEEYEKRGRDEKAITKTFQEAIDARTQEYKNMLDTQAKQAKLEAGSAKERKKIEDSKREARLYLNRIKSSKKDTDTAKHIGKLEKILVDDLGMDPDSVQSMIYKADEGWFPWSDTTYEPKAGEDIKKSIEAELGAATKPQAEQQKEGPAIGAERPMKDGGTARWDGKGWVKVK